MKLEQLVYTPQNVQTSAEHPSTFVLIVDGDAYEQHRNDASIPLANIVDSYDIFKYTTPGRQGTLARPSQREIEEVFGTTNTDECVQFMLDNGAISKHARGEVLGHKKERGDPK